MRDFFVYVRFPELAASHAEQTATVQAGNLALAAKRGLESIRRREHVRGRRIHEAVIRVNQSETPKVPAGTEVPAGTAVPTGTARKPC